MTGIKVRIEPETAAYYLEVESAFNQVMEKLRRISPVIHAEFLQERHMQTVEAYNLNQRYAFRCDMHDSRDRSIRPKSKWKTSNGVLE